MCSLPHAPPASPDSALTSCRGAPPRYNENILNTIIQECLDAVEASPRGQEFTAVRVALTEPIYKALGMERGSDFENLAAQSINHYGRELFMYGLGIGHNPAAVFDLPDSEYER